MNDFEAQVEYLNSQMQYFENIKNTLSKADKLAFLGRILAMGYELKQSENYKRFKYE